MHAITSYLWRQRYKFRFFLGHCPSIFLPLIRLKRKPGEAAVVDRTELVIDGFPRSGNTFAVVAFQMAQDRPVAVAHHLHVPAQITRAAELHVPTMLLIRNPCDAVVSRVIRNPHVTIEHTFREYCRFYEYLKPYVDHYVIAPFDLVVSDFGHVIQAVNEKFGTEFALFEHTEENLQRCFARIEQMDMRNTGRDNVTSQTVSRPSQERDRMKQFVREQLERDEYAQLIADAEAIYFDFTGALPEENDQF